MRKKLNEIRSLKTHTDSLFFKRIEQCEKENKNFNGDFTNAIKKAIFLLFMAILCRPLFSDDFPMMTALLAGVNGYTVSFFLFSTLVF